MTFTITHEVYEPAKDYLLITYDGAITMNTLGELTPTVIAAIRDHNRLNLVEDYRKATLPMDTNEIIKAEKFYEDYFRSKGISYLNVKRALIVDENLISPDDMSFFETLSVNRGQKLKVFTDMIKAIKWI
jgi:hypothetical protein